MLFFGILVGIRKKVISLASRKTLVNTIVALILFILTFLISLSWGENPFGQMISGHDTSIFIYIGKAITQGWRPYVDVTDHKGPVIFLLNALGWQLPHVHPSGGIYFVEFAFFFAFLALTYKTARLWLHHLPALLAPTFAAFAISPFTDGGNLTELYALPFISLILYYFLSYFKQGALPNYSYYLMGFGTLFIFGLRANMILALAPLFIILLVGIGWQERQWRAILPPLCRLIIGGLLFLMPLVIYLLINGSLWGSIQDSIITNMLYVDGDRSQLSAVITHIKALNSYGLITLLLVAIGLLLLTTANKKENWLCIVTLFVSYLVMFYAETMSGRAYPHYFMPLFPYYGLLVAYILAKVPKLQHPIVYTLALMTIVWNLQAPIANLYVQSYAVNTTASLTAMVQKVEQSKNIPAWTFPQRYTAALKHIRQREEVNQVTALVERLTTPNDRIYTHRLGGWYYLTTNRMAATRYFSLPAMNSTTDSEVGQAFFHDFQTHPPKVIIVPQKSFTTQQDPATVNGALLQFLNKNYHEVKQFDTVRVFEINN